MRLESPSGRWVPLKQLGKVTPRLNLMPVTLVPLQVIPVQLLLQGSPGPIQDAKELLQPATLALKNQLDLIASRAEATGVRGVEGG